MAGLMPIVFVVMRRWKSAVAVVAVSAGAYLFATTPFIYANDSEPDWLFVHAAWSGVDPYTTPWTDMTVHTVPNYGAASKTPAVAVVQSGWLTVPFHLVPVFAYVVNAAALVGICWLSTRIADRQFWWWTIIPVLALWPVHVSYTIGNPIFVWVFLILATWRLTQLRGDVWWVGLPLGVAVSVRLWPALIVVALWAKGFRRTAITAAVTAVGFNLAGLTAPGVHWGSVVDGLVAANAAWGDFGTNSSLVRLLGGSPVVAAALTVAAIVVAYKTRSMGTAAVLAVLVSPVSWMSYYLAAGPVFLRHWPVSLIPLILIGVSRTWWAVCVGGILLLPAVQRRLSGHSSQSSISERNVHDENPVQVTRQ